MAAATWPFVPAARVTFPRPIFFGRRRRGSQIVTPVLYENRIYFVNGPAAYCLDAATGKVIYKTSLTGESLPPEPAAGPRPGGRWVADRAVVDRVVGLVADRGLVADVRVAAWGAGPVADRPRDRLFFARLGRRQDLFPDADRQGVRLCRRSGIQAPGPESVCRRSGDFSANAGYQRWPVVHSLHQVSLLRGEDGKGGVKIVGWAELASPTNSSASDVGGTRKLGPPYGLAVESPSEPIHGNHFGKIAEATAGHFPRRSIPPPSRNRRQ